MVRIGYFYSRSRPQYCDAIKYFSFLERNPREILSFLSFCFKSFKFIVDLKIRKRERENYLRIQKRRDIKFVKFPVNDSIKTLCSSFLLHFINDRYDPFCFDSCRMKRFDASYACMIPVHILICTEEEGAQGHVDEVHLWHPLIDESWGLMDRGWCYGMKIWKRKRRSEKVMNSWSFHGRRWDKIGGKGAYEKGW